VFATDSLFHPSLICDVEAEAYLSGATHGALREDS